MNDLLSPAGRWRRATVVAAGLAAGTFGIVAAGAITGSAQAGETRPEITFNTVSPTIGPTLPPLTFVTVPPQTLVTIPPLTFVTVAPESTTTTEATTTTTAETTTTTSTEAPTTTVAQQSPPSAEPEYTIVIDLAQINCDGTIHVEYTTTADPAPATPANHMVVYNPTSLPAEFHVVETEGNAPNGSFVFDELGVIDQTYRLLVIALFDPENPDGPKVIDEADVLLVNGC